MSEQILLRLYLLETDKFKGAPAYQAVIKYLLKHDFAGATIFRGLEGFGTTHKVHSADILDLSSNLPIVIEVIDTRNRIDTLKQALKDTNMANPRLAVEQVVHISRLSE
jgi:uncharacterized protein